MIQCLMSSALALDHGICARRYRKAIPIAKAREGRLAAIAWLTSAVWVIGILLGIATVLEEFFRGDLSPASSRYISQVNYWIQVAIIGLCGVAMLAK